MRPGTLEQRGPGPGAASLFEPDVLLPAQWAGQCGHGRADTPSRRLCEAVLRLALDDARLARRSSAEARRDQGLARAWIAADDWEWPYSFVNLCAALGLEAEAVRRETQRADCDAEG